MQAVILAGGKGTRMRNRLGTLPKPMADVAGKPLLEHQIVLARSHGFDDILLLLGYNPESIREYFGDGSRFGVRIQYFVEDAPLGSGGAVLAALNELQDTFAVLYGDTMLNVDLKRFSEAHIASGADASLFLHPNDHPQDSDLVEIDSTDRITAFHPHPHAGEHYRANLTNAALYIVRKEAIAGWRGLLPPFDFARDLFPRMLQNGQRLYGYRSREYIKDAGTPERLDHVTADYLSGKIHRGSLATCAPAVFLDRDGTINEEVNRVKSPDEFRLLEGAAEAIRDLNRSEYKVVVITNQPVIARGDCTEEGLRLIHNKMETELGKASAFLDGIYYCPHHPDAGFDGERPELKHVCSCRKPAPGMIATACREMNLDLSRSWMVGDTVTDVRAAANAGIPSILLTADPHAHGVDKTGATHCAPSLASAVTFILSGSTTK